MLLYFPEILSLYICLTLSSYKFSFLIIYWNVGGHYVSYAKNSDSNKWYEFNDSRVSPISANDIPDVEGYLLFYQ